MVLPKIAICSIALGRAPAGHKLPFKLKVAKQVGYEGIELVMECLEYHAQDLNKELYLTDRRTALLQASEDVRRIADDLGLEVITIQPLQKYDALRPHLVADRLAEAKFWIECIAILGGKILQVPTCLFPATLDELDISDDNIAKNMGLLADACAEKGLEVGYEAPSWGIAFGDWQSIERIIKLSGRRNIKHCLDTFHIGAYECGDPQNAEAGSLKPDAKERLAKSLDELKKALKAEDISYFQLSDAQPIDLSQKSYPTNLRLPPEAPIQMVWSRNCRIYPCEPEHGGILPCVEIAKAIFETGFRGWCSMEVFHPGLYEEGEQVSWDWAERGMRSWEKMAKECGLK
ncbi:xylose isomerase-like protein [Meredithblackwellia eburnea MCA 4105]